MTHRPPLSPLRVAHGAIVVLVVTVACTLASTVVTAPLAAGELPPTRVLIVGDSVAQGSTGDWTWRYRLWRHLADADVDLVGPHTALHDLDAGTNEDPRYADSDFDTDHAARWGMAMVAMDQPVDELVARWSPDVVVETLGVNDLLFWQIGSARLLDAVRQFVADARSVDPTVDLVLGTIPQTWMPDVSAFNAGLPSLAAELDLPGSRVVATVVPDDFTIADTWDGSHPTATGEVKIAASMADALAAVGVGRPVTRPLVEVADGPVGVATDLRAGSEAGRITVSWRNPIGLTGTYLWLRDATTATDWVRLPSGSPPTDTSRVIDDLVDGHDYDLRLQAFKGTAVAPAFSAVLRARAGAPPEPTPAATPSPAPAPTVPGPSHSEPPLAPPGAAAPETVADAATPIPASTPTAMPRPSLARISGHRLRVSWTAVPGATTYVVLCRVGSSWRTVARTSRLRSSTRALVPGRQRIRVEALTHATLLGRSPTVSATVR